MCSISTLVYFPILFIEGGNYKLHSFWLRNTIDKNRVFFFKFFPGIDTGCTKSEMSQNGDSCFLMRRLSFANTCLILLLLSGILLNGISIFVTSRVFYQKHYRFGNCVILLSAWAYMQSVVIWYFSGICENKSEVKVAAGIWLIVTASSLQLICYL